MKKYGFILLTIALLFSVVNRSVVMADDTGPPGKVLNKQSAVTIDPAVRAHLSVINEDVGFALNLEVIDKKADRSVIDMPISTALRSGYDPLLNENIQRNYYTLAITENRRPEVGAVYRPPLKL